MKLVDRVRTKIRKKHFSIRTEEAYCSWIRQFILFHGKQHPKEMVGKERPQRACLSINAEK